MASKTKQMRQEEESIKRMIVDGHRRGVMDSEGRTVKTADGRPIARPRSMGRVTYHETFKREYA